MSKANKGNGQWLDTGQLAERLNVSAEVLSQWRLVGRGPAYSKLTPTPQGKVRYNIDDVIAWEKTLQRFTCNVDQRAADACAGM